MAKTKNKRTAPKKMNAVKKQKTTSEETRSYVSKDGHAHFKHTGGYYEVNIDAKGTIPGTLVGD